MAKIQSSENWPQLVAKIGGHKNIQQLIGALHYPAIFSLLPWGQQRLIVSKSKDIDECLFYIAKSIEGNWSRSTLESFIESDLYHTQGRLPSNFDKTLSDEYRLKVNDMFKDPYDFGFLKMPQVYQERDLEDALTHNITRFLLELGKGFTFYGRQVELIVSGTSYFLDMLFYHVRLKCFVVVS